MTVKEKITLIKTSVEDKKATKVVILDLRKVFPMADYWFICGAPSTIQTRTIAEAVRMRLKEKGILPSHLEGEESGEWILIDFGDVIVHIFRQEEREFYQLEKMWRTASLVYSEQENIDRLDQVG